MKLWVKLVLCAVAAVVCGVLAFLPAAGADGPQIERIRMPVESYDNGNPKTLVLAELATISKDGGINASDVRIELYSEAGELVDTIEAVTCTYNKALGIAESDDVVCVERDGFRITGSGFVWNAHEQSIKILRDVKVVLARETGMGLGFAGMAAGGRTRDRTASGGESGGKKNVD